MIKMMQSVSRSTADIAYQDHPSSNTFKLVDLAETPSAYEKCTKNKKIFLKTIYNCRKEVP